MKVKELKKEIVTKSAINVGYSTTVINKLPLYAIIEGIREIVNLGNINITDDEIQNILVTESVRAMNYQDFRDIAFFFFNNKKG